MRLDSSSVVAVAVVMDAVERLDPLFHRLRQVIVGRLLVGEHRVAAGLRHDDRVQRRRPRRHLQVRIVGMEIRARVLQPRRLPVLLHVGQDEDVRVFRMVELVDHVRLRRPEARRERRELPRRKLLPADAEHLAGVERALDLGERGIGEWLRKVDVDLDAKACAEWLGLEHLKVRSPPDSSAVTAFPSYFKKSGRINCGRNSGISGQTINAASTSSIGTSMIIVSLSA